MTDETPKRPGLRVLRVDGRTVLLFQDMPTLGYDTPLCEEWLKGREYLISQGFVVLRFDHPVDVEVVSGEEGLHHLRGASGPPKG